MKYTNYLIIVFIVAVSLFSKNLLANNNLPKLTCYDKKSYHAGRQNWDIDIDQDGVVYFANTDGLLYNIYGEWHLKTMSEKGIIRAVLADNDKIWCGGNEYGYFTKNTGDLIFHSLGFLEYEQVWDIIAYENYIVFLAETQVIYYNKTDQTTTINKFTPGIYSIVKWNGKIWSAHKDGQIGFLENGVLQNATTLNELKNVEVRKLFVHNNKLYIVTLKGAVYSFNGEKLTTIILPDILKGKALFSGMSFDSDSFCLATISEGFVRINENGTVFNAVNSKNGLLDNTVLSMASDELGNVWLGLDYGAAKVELQGPINQIFKGAATYDIKNFNNKTFIATNKGLYSNFNEKGFQLMENSGGQIWSLKVVENELYICNNNGLSKVKNNKALPSSINYTGIYDLAHFEGTNYFIFATYHGSVLMEKVGEQFNYIKNLNLWGNRKLNYDKTNRCIWGEFTDKGICQLSLSPNFTVEKKEFLNFSKVIKTENGFYFSDNKALFQYKEGAFHPSEHALVKTVKGPIQAMAFNKKGYLAYVQNREIKLSVLLPDGQIHSYNTLLTSLGENTISEFEFIDFHNDLLRLATDRGVTTFDINYQSNLKKFSKPVISSFTVLNEKNKTFHLPYPKDGIHLDSGNKDLKFKFGINKSNYDVVEYRYKLAPKQKNWTEWDQVKKELLLPQIKGGNYTLYLQSRVNGGLSQETSLTFSIKKLWYQTAWVILPIVLVTLVWVFGVIIIMTRINRKKLNRQKNVFIDRDTHKTLQLKNDQLLQYTEIISHKNEFLNKIKNGLEKMRNSEAKRWVNMITNEVNNEKKDFLFHKLFSEIHQDFISRLTEKYPTLTSNDIRVLSFIRINLDKNEICNLMNISSRSLDTNRYRLKKKLNLEQGADLNQFIRDL
ncbi:hypothetical protein [Tamlana sp. I1]|uniref:helix-turn-helix and ligand-binding sensor domain-containing protein n=1 Tax=Tamlana sp. I1 TaxID=2762061 RepID=UPI00188EED7A|nr:hypothetical protein [Tamlana sp. I1]